MFRKKPVVIEARQFPEMDDEKEVALANDICEWCGGEPVADEETTEGPYILINTLEGQMKARPGDWIIKGVSGEFYPCKADIFTKTYEQIERTENATDKRCGDPMMGSVEEA